MEDVANVTMNVAVPFGTHKTPRAAKVFPYLPYFDRCVNKEWWKPKQPSVVLKQFAVCYPLEESL